MCLEASCMSVCLRLDDDILTPFCCGILRRRHSKQTLLKESSQQKECIVKQILEISKFNIHMVHVSRSLLGTIRRPREARACNLLGSSLRHRNPQACDRRLYISNSSSHDWPFPSFIHSRVPALRLKAGLCFKGDPIGNLASFNSFGIVLSRKGPIRGI